MVSYKINRSMECGCESFGIDVFDGGKRVRSIPDISESAEEITELVEMCTELEIEPGQIDYIVEDFLTEFNYD